MGRIPIWPVALAFALFLLIVSIPYIVETF